MYEDLLLEKAKREKARRSQAMTGTPDIVEEMHEDISAADRAIVKNLSQSPEKSAAYLKRNNPQLDTRVWDGRVLVKSKGQKQWKTLDPDTGFFSSDFLYDVGDVAYDVASGVGEGAALVGAGLTTGGLGGVAAGAAAGAGSEALRQKLGQFAGIDQDVDMGDVATVGALSGAIPLAGKGLKAGYGAAKTTAKGATKYLAGVSEDMLQRMGKEGAEDALQKVEQEGVGNLMEDWAQSIKGRANSIIDTYENSVSKLKKRYNIDDDQQLKTVLEEELRAVSTRAQDKALDGKSIKALNKQSDELSSAIKNIDETAEVRKAMAQGAITEEDIMRKAFPEVASADEIVVNLPETMGKELDDRLSAIKRKYEELNLKGQELPLDKVKEIYEDEIEEIRKFGSPTGEEDELIELLDNDYTKRFATAEGEQLENIPYERASRIKKRLSDIAYAGKRATGSIKEMEKVPYLTNFYKKLERTLNDEMLDASGGAKGVLDPQYAKMDETLKLANRLFGDEKKARKLVTDIVENKKSAADTLRQLEKIDEVAGTDMVGMFQESVKAKGLTTEGMKQSELLKNATAYVKNRMDKVQGKKYEQAKYLKDRLGKATSPQQLLGEARMGHNAYLNESIEDISGKYGKDVGAATEDVIKELEYINYFADPSSRKLKGFAGTEGGNKGALSGTAGGIGGALGWSLGSAFAAQTTASAFRGITASAPVRKMLRKNLPKLFKADRRLNALSDEAKRQLAKDIEGTMFKRRDLLRELSKKLATDKDRG